MLADIELNSALTQLSEPEEKLIFVKGYHRKSIIALLLNNTAGLFVALLLQMSVHPSFFLSIRSPSISLSFI
jgi:cytochrome c oxidase subunit IV